MLEQEFWMGLEHDWIVQVKDHQQDNKLIILNKDTVWDYDNLQENLRIRLAKGGVRRTSSWASASR